MEAANDDWFFITPEEELSATYGFEITRDEAVEMMVMFPKKALFSGQIMPEAVACYVQWPLKRLAPEGEKARARATVHSLTFS